MFGRLIKILNTESASVGRHRNNGEGPNSLNVVSRRQRIRQINTDNERLSVRLSTTPCCVPTIR